MKHPLAMLLAAIALPACAAPARVFPVADHPVLEDRMPNPPVHFAHGVEAWRDVVYQQLPGYRPPILDIYRPATPGPHPLVLYIHGGGWIAGHTRHSGAFADFPGVLAALAAEGFTVASLEYRLSGEARFPAQLQDVHAALRFLVAHAARYRLDPSRIALWGGSAGGHLAALAALTCRNTALDPAAAHDPCARAAAIWYGVFDFKGMAATNNGNEAARKLLGCADACPDDRIAAVSPASYIGPDAPAFLLIHGEDDHTVPAAQSHAAQAALKAAGDRVRAIYIPGVDHSFIGKTPQATRAASLLAANATFDFFHQELKK